MEYLSRTPIRVRYAETDKMGIVHHSRYYPWFEVARGDYIKSAGLNYAELEKEGLLLPLTESGAKYIDAARYEEELTVTCRLVKLTYVRCVFEYEVIRDSDAKLITRGTTTHAFCDTQMRPVNLKKKFPQYYDIVSKLVCGKNGN